MPERNCETQATMDGRNFSRKPHESFNKSTELEHHIEGTMTRKGRITNLAAQRAGLEMASLGDKNYKAVEFEPGFFRDGGLVAGSTN